MQELMARQVWGINRTLNNRKLRKMPRDEWRQMMLSQILSSEERERHKLLSRFII
ncbi:hypothetical protein V6Z11_A02G111500 [Gossypium hirsutum]